MIFGPDGDLYVADHIEGINRFDGTTGNWIELVVSEIDLGPNLNDDEANFLALAQPLPPPVPAAARLTQTALILLLGGIGLLALRRYAPGSLANTTASATHHKTG